MDSFISVLKLYYRSLDKSFTIHELSKNLSHSYSYIYKTVHQMVKQGLLKMSQAGRAKLCSINVNSPDIINYLSIISTEESSKIPQNILNKLMELVSKLLKNTNSNVHAIVLFGSYAKAKQINTSDVDLLIIVPKKEEYDSLIHKEANSWEMRYSKELNLVISEPKMWQRMIRDEKVNVANEILKDGIPLYGAQKYWELTIGGLR